MDYYDTWTAIALGSLASSGFCFAMGFTWWGLGFAALFFIALCAINAD